MKVSRVLETCLYVDDLAKAEQFYERVLGFQAFIKKEGRHVFFRCGDGVFLLFNPDATTRDAQNGIPPHGAKGQGHVAFAVAEDEVEEWRRHLEGEGVDIESDYTWPSGGRSLYFRDPAGNSVELATPRTWEFPDPG